MLSGGNGTILPQSGGFSLISLGQSDSSLMTGDVPPVPIVAVGGADANEAEVKAENNAKVAKHTTKLASRQLLAKPVVEYYSVKGEANTELVKYTENVVKSMLRDSSSDENIKEIVATYSEEALKHWSATHPPPKADTNAATMNRLVHFLPVGLVDTIVVLPAVAGKLERFDYLLNFLSTIGVISQMQGEVGTLQERVRVVFMSPFYGEPQTTKGTNNNLALNYMFMKLKNANKGKIFYLADHSADSIITAQAINRILSPDGPLLSLLEPSYIRFTGPIGEKFVQGILIASDSGNLPMNDRDAYQSFTPTKDPLPESDKYITVNTTDHTVIDGNGGIGLCNTFLSEVDMNKINDKIGLDTADRIAVIRILVPNDRKPLCKQKSLLEGAPAFFAADMKSTAIAPKTSIFYNDKVYRIRKPLTKVISNWRAGVFTPGGVEFLGETDFLNDLGISPKLLGKVFPDEWVEHLTSFLEAVSLSKCFSDVGLLTYKDCDKARLFIKKIETHMMENDTSADFSPLVKTAPKTIPNDNGVSLDEVSPGGFMSGFMIGSHAIYATLTGWAMPVMIINRTNNEYILRQLSVNDTTASEKDVENHLDMYKQQYPDWLFLT